MTDNSRLTQLCKAWYVEYKQTMGDNFPVRHFHVLCFYKGGRMQFQFNTTAVEVLWIFRNKNNSFSIFLNDKEWSYRILAITNSQVIIRRLQGEANDLIFLSAPGAVSP